VPAYGERAIVLRKTKLGEADVILDLIVDDGRIVRAVAKGLRKPGSKFGGRLEPYSDVELLLHTGRNLEVVSEARTVTTHAGLREDYERQAAAAVVADVLDKIALEGQPDPRLFGLADATLSVLETCEVDRLPAVVVGFLVKSMAMHGYRPELESCAACASSCAASDVFSPSAGGVLCPTCGALDPSALRFPTQAREWLARLLGLRMADVAELEMPPAAVDDCFALLRSFIAYHVPARLRALEFYGTLR
jgi:DNA repair protein RecO (recombination protein O)